MAATLTFLSLAGTRPSVGQVPAAPPSQVRIVESTLPAMTRYVIEPTTSWSKAPSGPMSGTCAAVGDSLAVGSAEALRRSGVECGVVAEKGAATSAILSLMPPRVAASTIVLSAGVNDGVDMATYGNLRAIRSRLDGRVVWVLPVRQPARALVSQVCSEAGDSMVDLAPFVGRDGLHPDDMSGYAGMMSDLGKGVRCSPPR